jgi:hypothetical protein
MIRVLLGFIFLVSCASIPNISRDKLTGKTEFLYSDANGKYTFVREVKKLKSQLITRTRLYNRGKRTSSLETSVTVSRVGKRKDNTVALLPEASQFFVWFDKKKYVTNLKIDRRNRKLIMHKTGPVKTDNISTKYELPKSNYICFFSQLPECVLGQGLLMKSQSGKVGISIIWDSFPFNKEQYEGMTNNPVTQAEFYFSEKMSNSLRFELDLGNQIVFYHFDKKLKFEKMFWVSQGLSISAFK